MSNTITGSTALQLTIDNEAHQREIEPTEVVLPEQWALVEIARRIHARQEAKRAALLDVLDLHLADGRDLLEARTRLQADQGFGAWFKAQGFTFNQQWAWTLMQAARFETEVREAVTSQLVTGNANLERAVREVREAVGLLRTRKADPPPLPAGVYSVLYADPPWRYDDPGSPSRSIDEPGNFREHRLYPTLEVSDICALEVPSADDAVLFLWATNPMLREALQVIEAWGFEYRTNMVWIKDKIGMGYYARQRHELLLIARRGDIGAPREPASRPDSVIEAPRGEHSTKPHLVYELIERMYPIGPYRHLELFARNGRPGWEAWGNEAIEAVG